MSQIIKEWSGPTADLVKREILKTLQPLFDKYGLKSVPTSGTYSEDSFGFKLEMRVDGALDPKQKSLEMYARYHELDTDRVINIDGKEMKLWGYNSRARKAPWIVEDQAGKGRYKLRDAVAIKYFKKTNG